MIGVIGGSGLYHLPLMSEVEVLEVDTPYGVVGGLEKGYVSDVECVFVPRHGQGHKIPPHKIQYRANIWALKSLGIDSILSVNAVGGIGVTAEPGAIVIPDQIIDYTWGREHTYFDQFEGDLNHIDFTSPYSANVRRRLLEIGEALKLTKVIDGGVYGCTQGPRLETAAEIKRLARDGCTIVGMTAMPEASLAAELNMDYAGLCPVVNWAAGLSKEPITMADIEACLANAIPNIQSMICKFIGDGQSASG